MALGFGTGLSPVAPGTLGSLFGWASFVALNRVLDPLAWLCVLVGGFAIGVWVCERTGRDLGVADHGGIVWDEVLAMWIVLLFTPPGLVWQSLAFVLFRVFDIVKPPPVSSVDARVKGGLGVMLDDLLAACYALVVLALLARAWGYLHG